MSDGGGGGPLEPPPARQHRKMKRGICAHGVAHGVVVVAALGCLGCAVLVGSLVGWSMRTVRGARPVSRTNTSFTQAKQAVGVRCWSVPDGPRTREMGGEGRWV